MNSALNENQSELGVFVLSVSLKMLSDGDGLLDQMVQILRKLRGHSSLLQQSDDSATGHRLDLGDSLAVS